MFSSFDFGFCAILRRPVVEDVAVLPETVSVADECVVLHVFASLAFPEGVSLRFRSER